MADQQVALERLRELYREKNEHLEKFLEPVEPYEFYREIFPEGSFERKGHFEDRKGNGIAVTVAKSEVDKATGIALQIEGDGKAKRCTVTDELDELRELLGQQRTDSTWKTVERAKDFIARNYGDGDLSVETLCSYLHLSPTYFSTLFKRETGQSFTACVTERRMNEAARLLRDTEEKTYLIARKCGYDDPNYFSYVFKRHFGTTPTKYRGAGR